MDSRFYEPLEVKSLTLLSPGWTSMRKLYACIQKEETEFYLTLLGISSFSGLVSLYLLGKLLSNLKCIVPKILRGTGKFDQFGKGGGLN